MVDRRVSSIGSRTNTVEEIEVTAPPPEHRSSDPTPFDELFNLAYPAAVGLAQQVIDRSRAAGEQSRAVAEEVAVEALTKARARNLSTSVESIAKVVGWTADGCVSHLVGHPGRAALPPDVTLDELSDEADPPDLFADGGLPLSELQAALAGIRKADRRVGLLVFGAGLSPRQAGALLDRPETEVRTRVERVGIRLCDARQVNGSEPFAADRSTAP